MTRQMHIDFFGERQLYGAMHVPSDRDRAANPPRALVICSPLGQEAMRCHASMRRLAHQLARVGIHALRFDYHGTGDSPGQLEDILSFDSLQSDIHAAINHVRSMSGATHVGLVTLRTSMLWAWDPAANRKDVSGIVAWEPVLSGARWLAAKRAMQQRMLRCWHQRLPWKWLREMRTTRSEELQGFVYHASLLRQIDSTIIDPACIRLPQYWQCHASLLQSLAMDHQGIRRTESIESIQSPDSSSDQWDQLWAMEHPWSRPSAQRILVKRIQELFDRLESRVPSAVGIPTPSTLLGGPVSV